MGAPVARLPQGTSGDDGSVTPVELYKNAIEEYRFQAKFNWSRTQYMLVFNTGICSRGMRIREPSNSLWRRP